MMTALDRGIGQIIETLEQLEIRQNTLIVFLSDNGAPHPDHQGTNKSRNDPWRGYKGDLLEGGIRIPFLISYPAMIKPGMVCKESVSSLDLLITFAEITGADLNEKLEYPGLSLVPTWEGPQQKSGNPGFYNLETNPGEIPEQALKDIKLEKKKPAANEFFTRGMGNPENNTPNIKCVIL